ncbi:TetR/AcrR family transcriptional regulator [Nocardia sp. alder85J]|uniref:TetR/AcrR family transcriptional regulator n=1 Tax=Nocardia sp. alder85J TaxID=2862949 RepID=UPI001CD3E0E7|nr:TetR/AcrR family transcriptional regulator [Nocardia sp. alder85J]MCX4090999.1 TetR/AcrR family transcriptional regulator [Nocardia sp. alder85J]
MTKPTRARMIDAAVDGLRRQGLAGMSFTEVLAASGAARGAIYHHFPGGKAELVAEAARLHGHEVDQRLAELSGAGPRAVAEEFLTMVRPVIEDSVRGCGCAIAAVTVGSGAEGDELRDIAATTFAAWAQQLTAALAGAGMSPEAAADLAQLLIALLEGAQVLCRAAADSAPFERAARAALAAVPVK